MNHVTVHITITTTTTAAAFVRLTKAGFDLRMLFEMSLFLPHFFFWISTQTRIKSKHLPICLIFLFVLSSKKVQFSVKSKSDSSLLIIHCLWFFSWTNLQQFSMGVEWSAQIYKRTPKCDKIAWSLRDDPRFVVYYLNWISNVWKWRNCSWLTTCVHCSYLSDFLTLYGPHNLSDGSMGWWACGVCGTEKEENHFNPFIEKYSTSSIVKRSRFLIKFVLHKSIWLGFLFWFLV